MAQRDVNKLHDMRVHDVLAERLPDYRVTDVVVLGQGQDNVAYEVNGELIVRFAKHADPVETAREARLLTAVAALSTIPVPAPVFTDPALGCMAYLKLPGVQLLGQPRTAATSIAATLGEWLAVLHAVPVERMADVVDTDDEPLTQWLAEAAELYVPEEIPAVHRGPVERFLATAPPSARTSLVFSHNDLGVEHVLVDPRTWTVTGVIDWTDAALVDPAYDFGRLLRDLGPAALDAALAAYGSDEPRARAEFFARCTVFEDMAYGRDAGQRLHVDMSLSALDWLFEA
jgi:aminoglycoside phosphotransferase (APT) family kinase protein